MEFLSGLLFEFGGDFGVVVVSGDIGRGAAVSGRVGGLSSGGEEAGDDFAIAVAGGGVEGGHAATFFGIGEGAVGEQELDQRQAVGGDGGMQRRDGQSVARGEVRIGPGIEQEAGQIEVSEKAGVAEAGKAIGGVLVGEGRVGREVGGNGRRIAERRGFKEIGGADREKEGREFDVACVHCPQKGRGALGGARVGKRWIGSEEGADLIRVAGSNGVEEHVSVSTQTEAGGCPCYAGSSR